MNLSFIAQFLIVISLLITSCADDGPAGPAGPTGATGATGAAGAAGPTGTANVIYSDWFQPMTYENALVFSIRNFTYNQAVPAVTQDVLDKGVVLVYGKLSGYATGIWPTDQVGLMPVSLIYQSGGTQIDVWSALITAGNIKIGFTNSTNLYSSISNAHKFRYVIVPGGVAAGGRLKDLKSMSYSEAMAALGLNE